ncbi:DedA family protein [Sphingomonas sp. S-NIH.Pt15_0812]|jgi:membrane protein DedA with SNARE-associated domain|uniref:DedA family protein n=1 Tax=Sphingomonas sp. S-NIH.Pt15_0812 TaxID=1920129 RepID=UPI000F7EBA26|nr:DedA family protein [Sphingomonas sp. S-NIH.Pt15_0812]RSU50915.1 DedA family protein [Sphingomonas sp. S-NIH.Pt15_0812]
MTAISNLVATLAGWIVAAIAATGYFGIIGLMALESACIPLPSEIIMPFSGYLVSTGRLDLWLVAIAGAVGCNLGSALAYEAGLHGGRPMVERYGRWLLLTSEDLDRSERFFERFGGAAVLIGRMLPGIRSFIALPAGIAQMPLLRFHLYTFIGSLPWCLGLAYAGQVLGSRWKTDPRLSGLFHKIDLVLLGAIVLAAIWFVWRRLKRV